MRDHTMTAAAHTPPTLADPEKLESPPDYDALFGFSGPLELEIGAGKGGFAIGYCRKYPDRRLVAMEWRKKYAAMTYDGAVEHGLKNLLVLHCDAKEVVPKIFAPESLDCIHLQFPDPWWKRRHFKRRVVEPQFVGLWMKLLKPTGTLDIRTDVEARAHDMMKVLTKAGFENLFGEGQFAPYDPEDVPSTREHRYLERGLPVYRIRMKRPAVVPDAPRS